MRRYVLGLGNYLRGDDGIGIHVVDRLLELERRAGFEAVRIGNDGFQVLTYFRNDVERVLMVDCALMGLNPGEYRVFSPDSVESDKAVGAMSTHEEDALRLVAMGIQNGCAMPVVRILAVQPGNVNLDAGPVLSEPLKKSLETYVQTAVCEIMK